MQPQPSDPLVQGVVIVLAIASFAVWLFVVSRFAEGPLLRYEPRRPVPWSGVWILLPLLLTSLAVLSALRGNLAVEEEDFSAAEAVQRIAMGIGQEVALVVAFLAVAVAVSGATTRDMGLPGDRGALVRSVRIGVLAWLASLTPVYLVQILLLVALGESEGHPLIQMLIDHATPAMFGAVFVMAVIVAPVCEEILFRLLLQGWLEKWEVERMGDAYELPLAPAAGSDETGAEANAAEVAETFSLEVDDGSEPLPGVAGLPRGWVPILISSSIFALAHAGYGAEPVPLFILALILGYVYQRTHWIVPSIVAHALFNGMTFFVLWRMIAINPQ